MNNRLVSILAFGVLALLWLVFLVSLVIDQQALINLWASIRSLPGVVQVGVALLTLPVFIGLWAWQTSLPVLVRLVIVLGLAWATVYTFFPWKKAAPGGDKSPVHT